MFAVIIFLLVIFTLFSVIQIRQRSAYKKFYNLPSPLEVPYLGIAAECIIKGHYKVFMKYFEQLKLPCRFVLNKVLYYNTANPADIKIIFNHPNSLNKGDLYVFMSIVFEETLLIANADMWKVKRKILSKCFNKNLLNGFVPLFDEHSKKFVNKLGTSNFSSAEDIFYTFQMMTSAVFLDTMLGANNSNYNYGYVISRAQELIFKRAYNILQHNDFIYKYTADSKEFQNHIREFSDEITSIIEKRVEYLKTANLENKQDEVRKVFIDVLVELENEGAMTRKDILHEIFLFTGAATDTTSNTLAFTCTLLGMHPEVQNKVLDEVLKVVGPTNEIKFTDLPDLKYTEQVINESMRILPPVPIVTRNATEDIELDSKMVIPKNCDILVSKMNLHRDKKYYPNPTKFDPERFSPEEVAKRHPYAFLPFAGGPRNCIGNKYAMMLMKTTIANIVRNLDVFSNHKSVEELDLDSLIVMSASNLDCRFKFKNTTKPK